MWVKKVKITEKLWASLVDEYLELFLRNIGL